MTNVSHISIIMLPNNDLTNHIYLKKFKHGPFHLRKLPKKEEEICIICKSIKTFKSIWYCCATFSVIMSS